MSMSINTNVGAETAAIAAQRAAAMSDNNVWACRLPKAMTNAEKEDLRKLVAI